MRPGSNSALADGLTPTKWRASHPPEGIADAGDLTVSVGTAELEIPKMQSELYGTWSLDVSFLSAPASFKVAATGGDFAGFDEMVTMPTRPVATLPTRISRRTDLVVQFDSSDGDRSTASLSASTESGTVYVSCERVGSTVTFPRGVLTQLQSAQSGTLQVIASNEAHLDSGEGTLTIVASYFDGSLVKLTD